MGLVIWYSGDLTIDERFIQGTHIQNSSYVIWLAFLFCPLVKSHLKFFGDSGVFGLAGVVVAFNGLFEAALFDYIQPTAGYALGKRDLGFMQSQQSSQW